MALNFLGSRNNVPSGQLPDDYVKPTITPSFKGSGWTKSYNIEVTKSTVENADPATTVDNIVTDVDSQLTALISADLVVTGAVEAYGIISSIRSNQVFEDDLYNDSTVTYVVAVQALTDA